MPQVNSLLHTIVLSDIHLADAELGQAGRSLWKRYKRPKFFIDQSFKRLLDFIAKETKGDTVELVLNGDIFDFDSVMRLPLHSNFHISWLERRRGLFPEEEKSRFKMEVILGDHPVWVKTLADFIRAGNQVVIVFGNHDIELHWPQVQKEFLKALALTEDEEKRIRFCEWFYISGHDTAIEHGNQYDDYTVTANPIHPLIKKGKKILVRLPFGNISGRYMVNGMGLFNPHVEASFLMTFPEYLKFVFKYALRIQPFLLWTWFWGATATFIAALGDGFLPALRDPLYTEQRVEEIARKANTTPTVVRMMNELKVHPAIFNPIKIARELWLDRFFVLAVIGFVSFEIYAVVHLVSPISWVWFLGLFVAFIPLLFYYARNIESNVIASTDHALQHAPTVAKVTQTKRFIFGHTHRELHTEVGQTEVINTGTWSPAFRDPECTISYGKKCFAWVKPHSGAERTAQLYIWNDPGVEVVPKKV